MIIIRAQTLKIIRAELACLKPSPQTRHIDVDGHDVIEVRLTDQQVQLIMEKAVEVTKDPNLPNKLGGPSYRWFVGFLGQLGFFVYGFDDFQRGYSKLRSRYEPDNHDCIFRGWNLDVKTNGRPDGDRMMVPEYQFAQRHDFYVACQLKSHNPYVIWIWGYATRKELEQQEPENYLPHKPTRAILFQNLHPIIELKDLEFRNT